jgi:hypothetical protein
MRGVFSYLQVSLLLFCIATERGFSLSTKFPCSFLLPLQIELFSILPPLMWIALTWQGGLTQVCQSLGTKNPQVIHQCNGRDCPSGTAAVRWLTGRMAFLLFSWKKAKGEKELNS